MTPERLSVCALFGLGAIIALWYATTNDDERVHVPARQTEAQFLGLNVPDLAYGNPGGPLDMSPDIHFWAPGWTNSGATLDNHPVVITPHRYPVVTGGNISTVMHYGWSNMAQSAPANDDWRLNPPEVAVL